MNRKTNSVSIYEILDLVNSRIIPLDTLKDTVINNYSYEDLINLQEKLELLLFLLDLKLYCSYCKSDEKLNSERKIYRREIKKVNTKVRHLIKKRKKEFPEIIQLLIDDFDGAIIPIKSTKNISPYHEMIVRSDRVKSIKDHNGG